MMLRTPLIIASVATLNGVTALVIFARAGESKQAVYGRRIFGTMFGVPAIILSGYAFALSPLDKQLAYDDFPISVVLGMLLIAFGGALLFITRNESANGKWLIYGLVVPALGCGGCLFLFPTIAFVGGLAIFFGAIEFCKLWTSC